MNGEGRKKAAQNTFFTCNQQDVCVLECVCVRRTQLHSACHTSNVQLSKRQLPKNENISEICVKQNTVHFGSRKRPKAIREWVCN